MKQIIKIFKYLFKSLLKPTEVIKQYPTNVTVDHKISMVKYHWGEIEHDLLIIAKIKWLMFFKYRWKFFIFKSLKILIILSIIASASVLVYKNYKPKFITLYKTDTFETQIKQDSTIIIRDVMNPNMKKYFDYIASTEVRIVEGDTLAAYKKLCDDTTSSAIGRYQMLNVAREQIGLGGVSKYVFLNNPELQDVAMYMLLKDNYRCMKDFMKKWEGKMVNGYYLTEPGMLSLAHALGANGAMNWIEKGCYTSMLPPGAPHADTRLTLQKYKIVFK